jgi:EXS family
VGGLAEAQDGKFGDILLADVLTSYSKVLGDLFVCICMFFSRGASSTGNPNRGCGGAYMVPLIISVPSLIRLRQCLIEFHRVRKQSQTSDGWGGQHLANALKYSSAFPVIILSALQRGYDPAKILMSETGLFRLWFAHSDNFLTPSNRSQAGFRVFELLLFVLLGYRQGLGPQPVLVVRQTKRSSAPIWPSAASTFPCAQDVLCSDHYRFPPQMHMELQAFTTFGPLQRLGRWNIHDGDSGSFAKVDVDLLPC